MSTMPSDRGSVRHANGRGIPTRLVPLVAGTLLVLALVAPVSAHSELEISDPADGATLTTPPTQVVLGFTEDLADKSGFKLLGPDGSEIGTGSVGADTTTMSLTGLSLGVGAYTVEWTSVSTDGDVLRGKLTFTVAEPTPAPATQTPAPTAAPSAEATARITPEPTVEPSVAVSAAPTPAPSADTTPASSSGTDVLIPIVVALVLVGVFAAWFLRRNRAGA